jgi:16S rRNA (adenine1518-N6/adenine1519-N6)-dimethyltransferase
LDQEHIVDPKLLTEMVDLAEITESDIVLEVGPGIGSITELMAERAKYVYAVEKDRQFERVLRDKLQGRCNVGIVFCNVMEIKLPSFDKIVSNLPFSICESFLQKLVHSDFELGALIVPISFAEIITAESDRVSKLSIMASAFYKMEMIRAIGSDAFYPAPDFRCALLKLTSYDANDIVTAVIRSLFRQRDKKAKNALRTALIEAYRSLERELPKLEARRTVETLDIEQRTLETKIGALSKDGILQIIKAVRNYLS